MKEQRLPLRRDLDSVAPEHPVVVVRGGHEYILNSPALARWNITKTTPQPDGGRIGRYDDGELNGELVDRARDAVTLPPPAPRSFEQRLEDQIAEYHKLHASGLTTVRHPGGSVEQYRLLQEIKKRGRLDMRVVFLFVRCARSSPTSGRTPATTGFASAESSSAWTAGSRAAGCAIPTWSRGEKEAITAGSTRCRRQPLQLDASAS